MKTSTLFRALVTAAALIDTAKAGNPSFVIPPEEIGDFLNNISGVSVRFCTKIL